MESWKTLKHYLNLSQRHAKLITDTLLNRIQTRCNTFKINQSTRS